MKGGDLTGAFSRAGSRAEVLFNAFMLEVSNKRGQDNNWLPEPCLLRVQKRGQLLRNPCVLGGHQKGVQNQKWRYHLCLLKNIYLQANGPPIRWIMSPYP